MNLSLSLLEARVIGCLIEKQITTPDQYPLSLNALTNACNQKSNRDPVMQLDERTLQSVVDGLVRRHMIIERAGFGSRVPKYHQIFCNAEFGSLKLTPIETAIICELLVRGAQTPGELRTRAARMARIQDVSEVEAALDALASRAEGALVVRLAREPGRRDSRYAQLLTGVPSETASEADEPLANDRSGAPARAQTDAAALADRVAVLEAAVQQLRQELTELKTRGSA